MSFEIEDIGIGFLTDEQLEDLASSLENKVYSFIQQHKYWQLLADFSIIIDLNQDTNKILTLVLDSEISGGLTTQQLEEFQSEIFKYSQSALKEELEWMKSS